RHGTRQGGVTRGAPYRTLLSRRCVPCSHGSVSRSFFAKSSFVRRPATGRWLQRRLPGLSVLPPFPESSFLRHSTFVLRHFINAVSATVGRSLPRGRPSQLVRRFHDLHLPNASGDRTGSPGRVPKMRDDPGTKNYRGRGRGRRAKRDAIVVTKILDRGGSYHFGFIAGDGSCDSRPEHRFNCPKTNRKMD